MASLAAFSSTGFTAALNSFFKDHQDVVAATGLQQYIGNTLPI
jgi:hypothetical protein